jgi:hypothetical protein
MHESLTQGKISHIFVRRSNKTKMHQDGYKSEMIIDKAAPRMKAKLKEICPRGK